MSSPYGSRFDGMTWPWELIGSDGWWALHDATGRYVSDACVEGDTGQMRDLSHALRGRHDYRVKRCALAFHGDEMRFHSPRNSCGGYAVLPTDLADALADIIDTAIAAETEASKEGKNG